MTFAVRLAILMLFAVPAAAERLFVAIDASGKIDEAGTAALILAARAELGDIGFADNQAALRDMDTTGSICMPQDSVCWMRIHRLTGVDETWVLIPMANSIGSLSRYRDQPSSSPVLTPATAGLRSAMQRILGTTAAIVLTDVAAGSVVTMDGRPRDSWIIEGITPGWHKVEMKLGDNTRQEDVLLQAGQVLQLKASVKAAPAVSSGIDEEVVLPPAASADSFPWLGTILVVAGAVALAGGGVVLAPAVIAWGGIAKNPFEPISTTIGVALGVAGAAMVGVGAGVIVAGWE